MSSSDTVESTALAAGLNDATYLNPLTAVRAWQVTCGQITIIASTASGRTELVVRKNITHPSQLAHAVLAAPAAGTQQAALNWWLRHHGVPGPGPDHVTMTSTSFNSRELHQTGEKPQSAA